MPPTVVKKDGTPRRLGVEIELQGIPVDMLARLTALTLDGQVETISPAEYRIDVPDLGDFRVEVDFALLKDMARERYEADDEEQSVVDDMAFEALSAASSLVVPCEVVTPPIAMERISEPLQVLTDAIRDAGGKGTRHSPFYAFGVHLNIEPADLESHTIVAYMKAFVCLFDWLAWEGEVDPVRRATPYIQRYPTDYDLHLTDPGYWPGPEDLIVDYLNWNASRNRALDMLPMLSEINPAAVSLAVGDDLVNARPAFHYRLANCAIDEPDWSIADPWQRWLQIEYLANDRDALNECCTEYRRDRERLLHRVDSTWREKVTRWLNI